MRNENDRNDGRIPPSSRLYLPKLTSPPSTILEHLITRFGQISPDTWRDRFARGLIRGDDHTTLRDDSPYRHGLTVFYPKQVPGEPDPLEAEEILYRDSEILVADKPHGMLVRPAGNHVERSLLVRLQRETGAATITPAHQLDRDTAGIVLFTLKPASRGRYQGLFADQAIEREYKAVAEVRNAPEQRQWRVENRLEAGEPWYRRRIAEGASNAITDIELLQVSAGIGLFRIRPQTGKKHQIRVHMASIGFPIMGDTLYPRITARSEGSPPLQLLAARLSFIDPVSGAPMRFESKRELVWQR